jgi:hypothetical protein
MSSSAKDFYLVVVNEVIEKNRQNFINEGVSEDVLEKLRKIWEEKINQKLNNEGNGVDQHGGIGGGHRGVFPGHHPAAHHIPGPPGVGVIGGI